MFKALSMAAVFGFCLLPVGASAAPAGAMSIPIDGASELTPVHYQYHHHRRHRHGHVIIIPGYRWGSHHHHHRWHHHDRRHHHHHHHHRHHHD